jgi:glycosyltransferase involved in cell wall biosynthesis
LVTPLGENLSVVRSAFAGGSLDHVERGTRAMDLGLSVLRTVHQWKPDLIHSHGFTSAAVAEPIAVLTRTPHLLTAHDVLLDAQFIRASGAIRRWGMRRLLASVDHVMAVGQDALVNLQEFAPSLRHRNAASAVRNGIETGAFLGQEIRDLRRERDLDEGVLLLGFFGRFMAQKGFRLLAEAVREVRKRGRDVQVACFGWGGFIREEQAMLRHEGLEAYFHFFPHTDVMAAALRGVDAVVMPSRWEACPLLPMEAMVAGVPLIASDCIGLREVIEDTPALAFRSGDGQALAQRIEILASERHALRQSAEDFREQAAQRFDVRHTAAGLARIYSRFSRG